MLTPKQQQLLDYIRSYLSEHQGVAPSFIEMRDALGLHSKSGVHRLLTALEERGFIHRMRERARAIWLRPQLSQPLEMATDRQLAAEAQRRGYVMGTWVWGDNQYRFDEVAPIVKTY